MAKQRRRPTPKRAKLRPMALTKTSLTIRFKTEAELCERLAGLSALFGRPAAAGDLEVVAGVDSCLSLIQAVQIVAKALEPKTFNPPEKLGDTYLLSQERELFKARTVKGVVKDGCQIADAGVPAEEGTTHSAVVAAIRENAHG